MKHFFALLVLLCCLIALMPASAQVTIAVTPNNASGGTITGDGSYNANSSVTLVATAAPGYEFASWNEGGTLVTYKNPYTFSATKNRNLVVIFKKLFTIAANANPLAGGKIEGADTYYWDDSVSLTAVDSVGYGFVSWTENGKLVSSNSSITFKVTKNRSFVANFDKIFSIEAKVKPADSVMAAGEVEGTGTYFNKDTITLDATAAPGYEFANWTEGSNIVSGKPSYTFQVSRNRNLVANFKRVFRIDAKSSNTNYGTVSGKGNYSYNDTVTLMATPAYGYMFRGWVEGSKFVSYNPKYSFKAAGDRNLVASFGIKRQILGVIGINFSSIDLKPYGKEEGLSSYAVRKRLAPSIKEPELIRND